MLNLSQIKQYQNAILTNMLSSQFVYAKISQKCELKSQKLIIQNKKIKKIHYLYLFLTTHRRPYLKKYYTFSKNSNKNSKTKTKAKSITWGVSIKNIKFSEIVSDILFQIIPFQTISEKTVLKLHAENLDLIFHSAPLTERTISLKPKNSYLSEIPLTWRLKWTSASLFQKIFILKHLKILNENRQFKKLENEIV
jgi:hypothetical protein